ncbi:tRNA (uridine(54)-C5)-methyltransferase TrmA [Thorsellia kenyensis]|uniref:tRNA/tmRNA (uracil-C(5))-methyltransferase n=1 Tax=Thorsellia kenyensis TaxID=1549888 RepID=A0ABV6CCD6_9GAMM
MPFKELPTESYYEALSKKENYLKELLAQFETPQIKVYESPKQNYRMRAEFRIWHEGDDLYHIMYDKNTREKIKLTQFPVASLLINQVMPILIEQIKVNELLRFKLFQVDYLSTQSGKILVSLLYHKALDDKWIEKAKKLRKDLINMGFDIQIIGRSHKQKITLDVDYVDEVIKVKDKKLVYRQIENGFTQPNVVINEKMLDWVFDATKESEGSLLELYCGNGNFSIAIAENFRRVLATEIAKSSVEIAQYNIMVNQINNLSIIRLSAEEFTQAIKGVRQFNRLAGIDLNDFSDCQTVLVDPPRSGLDEKSIEMIQYYSRIIYISCNPLTLVDNLKTLSQTHKISHLALFDQFPYTDHIETGIILDLKS